MPLFPLTNNPLLLNISEKFALSPAKPMHTDALSTAKPPSKRIDIRICPKYPTGNQNDHFKTQFSITLFKHLYSCEYLYQQIFHSIQSHLLNPEKQQGIFEYKNNKFNVYLINQQQGILSEACLDWDSLQDNATYYFCCINTLALNITKDGNKIFFIDISNNQELTSNDIQQQCFDLGLTENAKNITFFYYQSNNNHNSSRDYLRVLLTLQEYVKYAHMYPIIVSTIMNTKTKQEIRN